MKKNIDTRQLLQDLIGMSFQNPQPFIFNITTMEKTHRVTIPIEKKEQGDHNKETEG